MVFLRLLEPRPLLTGLLALAVTLAVFIGPCRQAHAQDEIEAGASQNYIYIEPGYDGTTIVLFGAIGREKLNGQPFDVAVTLQGPEKPVALWKKARHAGIWINSERLIFEGVPNYYAALSTRPVQDIAPLEERKAYSLGLDALTLPVETGDNLELKSEASREFAEALIRLKTASGLFVQKSTDAVTFLGARLFRCRVDLPASAGAGLYRAKFFVLQDGKVIGETSAHIRVRKIGIEASLSSAAVNYPWLYGLLAVAMAAAIGGGTSLIVRRL